VGFRIACNKPVYAWVISCCTTIAILYITKAFPKEEQRLNPFQPLSALMILTAQDQNGLMLSRKKDNLANSALYWQHWNADETPVN
jgi:hypothetical protein